MRHAPNDRICVCCYTKNGDGKFHNEEHFVTGITAAEQIIEANYDLAGAIWSNLQKLQANALSRSKETVEAYTHLLVDVDRRVKTRELKDADGTVLRDAKGKPLLEKINATEEERAVLLESTNKIAAFLREGEFGWGPGVMADSGNGYHLDWAIRPLDPKTGKELYRALLKVLAQKFQSPDVNMEIDVSMTNETRVITVWGTWNRKYPHLAERPQRQTRVLASPKKMNPLSESQIELKIGFENLVDDAPKAGAKKANPDWPEVNPLWLEDYGVEHLCKWGMPYTPLEGESYEKGGETHYRLGNCITSRMGTDGFYEHHQGGNKRQTELILGKTLGYKCFSNDCDAFTIKDWLRCLGELKGERYPHRIFEDDTEKLIGLFEAEAVEETSPRPEERGPNGRANDESYNLKGLPCPICNKELVAGAQDQECRSCMAEALTAVEEGKAELLRVKDKGGNTIQVVTINAASVRAEPLTWTWKNRIPDASITWFVGKPGQGKSLASINVAATVSTGRDWDDGARNTMGPKRVLMYCPEDSISRVVVPRLVAAGADLSKIDLLDSRSFRTYCPDGTKIKRCLAMDEDMPALLTLLGKHPDIALMICDPITGIWGDTNVNHNKEIWPVVANLIELCEKRNLTFLGVAHTNKRGSDADAIDKIQGGSTMAGAARAAFLFSRDPDSEDKHDHVMTNVKVNYTDEWNGLKFRTVGATAVTGDNRELETVRLDWLEATEMSADDVMDKQREKKANGGSGADGKLGLAKAFLTTNLQAGNDIQFKLIQQGEEKEGISRATMFRAAKDLGLTSSATKPKRWFLPYREEPENRMPDNEVL